MRTFLNINQNPAGLTPLSFRAHFALVPGLSLQRYQPVVQPTRIGVHSETPEISQWSILEGYLSGASHPMKFPKSSITALVGHGELEYADAIDLVTSHE
jgi:hypothetical protein